MACLKARENAAADRIPIFTQCKHNDTLEVKVFRVRTIWQVDRQSRAPNCVKQITP